MTYIGIIHSLKLYSMDQSNFQEFLANPQNSQQIQEDSSSSDDENIPDELFIDAFVNECVGSFNKIKNFEFNPLKAMNLYSEELNDPAILSFVLQLLSSNHQETIQNLSPTLQTLTLKKIIIQLYKQCGVSYEILLTYKEKQEQHNNSEDDNHTMLAKLQRLIPEDSSDSDDDYQIPDIQYPKKPNAKTLIMQVQIYNLNNHFYLLEQKRIEFNTLINEAILQYKQQMAQSNNNQDIKYQQHMNNLNNHLNELMIQQQTIIDQRSKLMIEHSRNQSVCTHMRNDSDLQHQQYINSQNNQLNRLRIQRDTLFHDIINDKLPEHQENLYQKYTQKEQAITNVIQIMKDEYLVCAEQITQLINANMPNKCTMIKDLQIVDVSAIIHQIQLDLADHALEPNQQINNTIELENIQDLQYTKRMERDINMRNLEYQQNINDLDEQLSNFEFQRTQISKDILEANDPVKLESFHNAYNTLIKNITDLTMYIAQQNVLHEQQMTNWINEQNQAHKQHMDKLHDYITKLINQQKKETDNDQELIQQLQLQNQKLQLELIEQLKQQDQKFQQEVIAQIQTFQLQQPQQNVEFTNKNNNDKNIFEE